MKKCGQCGTRQSDSRFFCIDCGTKLGNRLTAQEEAALNANTEAALEKLYDRKDLLKVRLREKVLGCISLVCMIAEIVLLIAFFNRVPDFFLPAIYAIALFLVCVLSSLAPKLLWELEMFQISMWAHNAYDLEPSDNYLLMRKIAIYAGFVAALLIMIYSLFTLVSIHS